MCIRDSPTTGELKESLKPFTFPFKGLSYSTNVEDYEGLTTFPYVGYAVAPKKGRAVIWYNFKDDGEYDIRAGHVGSPVIKGEKWALNIWIKENELKNNKEIDKKFIEAEHKKYPPKKKLELIP